MTAAILIAFVLVGLTGAVHYSFISLAHFALERSRLKPGPRLVVALYVVAAAHLVEAGLYACGFAIGRILGIGFVGDGSSSSMELFYFSLVNYTSLGLGDIHPAGHLRFLAGVESLNGFLLISCSAAFIYVTLSRPLSSTRRPDSGGSASQSTQA